jgi:hypothetical protein
VLNRGLGPVPRRDPVVYRLFEVSAFILHSLQRDKYDLDILVCTFYRLSFLMSLIPCFLESPLFMRRSVRIPTRQPPQRMYILWRQYMVDSKISVDKKSDPKGDLECVAMQISMPYLSLIFLNFLFFSSGKFVPYAR